jgi:6-pyruvoyltetrahydropterin/6-carboxytetrahydropterin synthase
MSAPPRSAHRIYVGKDRHKFSCAHMTVFPDGSKERLHGHNFQVRVALDLRDLAFERFVDFGVIKRAVEALCRAWDERLLLGAHNPFLEVTRSDGAELEFVLCSKRYVVPADEVVLLPVANVTVELLAAELAAELVRRLVPALPPDVVEGVEVEVSESEGQSGSCYLRA